MVAIPSLYAGSHPISGSLCGFFRLRMDPNQDLLTNESIETSESSFSVDSPLLRRYMLFDINHNNIDAILYVDIIRSDKFSTENSHIKSTAAQYRLVGVAIWIVFSTAFRPICIKQSRPASESCLVRSMHTRPWAAPVGRRFARKARRVLIPATAGSASFLSHRVHCGATRQSAMGRRSDGRQVLVSIFRPSPSKRRARGNLRVSKCFLLRPMVTK
jgi:hypothetical protein